MEIIGFLILSLLVIVTSGIVSSTEIAILSISYPKVKEILSEANTRSKQKAAEALIYIKEDLNKYITTLVILTNIINIAGSMYIGVVAADIFGSAYIGLVSGGLTFLIIIFSEIIPKILGERYSTSYSQIVSRPLIWVTYVLYPMILFFNGITHLIVGRKANDSQVSEGEIKQMAVLGKQEGSINEYESELIENVFELNDTDVYDVMVPKKKVVTLDTKSSFDEIAKKVVSTGFTRFPVVNRKTEVIGIVNTKDLFRFVNKESKFNIKEVLRTAEFAPEGMKVSTLERKLRRNRTHMAIIVNEHGDFTGIVTLEDIFEELVGEIEDEFDAKSSMIKEKEPGRYIIDAAYDIEELDERFELNLDTDGDFTTINGYIIHEIGRIPDQGESIPIGKKGIMRINKANDTQVLKIELVLKNKKNL